VGFEGGQMPLQRRIPKGGFKNINRVEYAAINLDILQGLAEAKKIDTIDRDVLVSNHLINKKELFKVLGRGEVKSKLNVSANAFSQAAIKAIEAAGGTATIIAK
jgi:large subunit ribosomal protein L15